MTFLERWANPEPSKPPAPAILETASSEPIEAGSRGVYPSANLPGMPERTQEELAHAAVNDIDTSTTSLKGSAVELWRDSRRFFLVADDEDAREAMRRFGAHRGEVWTSGELELVAAIPDQATRDEIEHFKRELGGCLSPGAAGKCISAAEWQAQMLNQMFKDQGVLGEPAKITAKNVLHGEGKHEPRR
jgi:hypothetical protein